MWNHPQTLHNNVSLDSLDLSRINYFILKDQFYFHYNDVKLLVVILRLAYTAVNEWSSVILHAYILFK